MNETFDTATEHAREDARRLAVNEASYFIKSYSEMKNFKLKEERFVIIAAAIMEDVENEDIRFIPVDGGKSTKITCHIKVKVDTSKINLEEILGNELQYQKLEEQNKKIQQLEEENKKLKLLNEQATSENEKLKIKTEFDKNRQQFLITKYERDLDLFDFNNAVDWKNILPTAKKLQEIEHLNATAFRATIYAYRKQGDLKKSVDYCNKILNSNCPDDTAIEALTQLGDIYYNEFQDKATAKKFVDKGISLCKKNYSAAMIEKFVNGTNFQISEWQPVGKTNTIRELYILKCNLENVFPTFKRVSTFEDMLITENRIYDINYRTNW